MPKISVVIPCFNLGTYLCEAIDSVLSQTFQDIEIIVVNDGSTDQKTNQIIDKLDKLKVKVINISNQGPSVARNIGIAQANGEYILPLDADDKIAPTYLEKAVQILDENGSIGIVYCKAMLFGQVNREWELSDYEFPNILLDNVIFCSAVFRKKDWNRVNGYNPNMTVGWEDYDFWLSIIELGKEVHKIPEYLFFYRKRIGSRTDSIEIEQYFDLYKQIFLNHKELYANNIDYLFRYIHSLREENCRLKESKKSLELQVSNWQMLYKLPIKSVKKNISSLLNKILKKHTD